MIDCGEKPLVESEDSANAPPQNGTLVLSTALAIADTFVANFVHLRRSEKMLNDDC